MFANARLMFGLGVVLAPCLFAASAAAITSDETYALSNVIDVPLTAQNTQGGLNLTDIAFVDPVAGVYVLADRSNFAVDVISTGTNKVTKQLQANPAFAGPGASNGMGGFVSGTGGPNGVLIANGTFVWAGDYDLTNASCGTPCGVVKVLNLYTGTTVTIPVGGNRRADELCFDPFDHIILIGSPSETNTSARFITFIDSNTYQILGQIVMDGTLGKPLASGGIEQCQYSWRTGKFYINLPGAHLPPDPASHPLVLQIDPVSEQILNVVDLTSTACGANNGMSIGPSDPNHGGDGQIGLGCTTAGPGSVIISENFGPPNTNPAPTVIATLPNTFTDEMWFSPGDNHYFYGNSTLVVSGTPTPQLGVVDALGENGTGAPEQDFYPASAEGSSTVAVDPLGNQAYVVIKNSAAAQKYKICSTISGDLTMDGRGCIAVYTPTGTNDPGSCFQPGGSLTYCGPPPE
jgi:hypothetical protein